MTVIVKVGDALPEVRAARGDYPEWIRRRMAIPETATYVADPRRGEALPAPEAPAAVVVTGSSALVTDRAAWSERTARWLAAVVRAGTPVLGICYGHQLLAHALGGRVGPNPRGREIGTIRVRTTGAGEGDPLLAAIAPEATVQATHGQSVTALPPGAVALAENDHDGVQAMRVGPAAWGVQFHPEFDAAVSRAYIRARAERLRAEGLDPVAHLARLEDTDHGERLLARFAALAAEAAEAR